MLFQFIQRKGPLTKGALSIGGSSLLATKMFCLDDAGGCHRSRLGGNAPGIFAVASSKERRDMFLLRRARRHGVTNTRRIRQGPTIRKPLSWRSIPSRKEMQTKMNEDNTKAVRDDRVSPVWFVTLNATENEKIIAPNRSAHQNENFPGRLGPVRKLLVMRNANSPNKNARREMCGILERAARTSETLGRLSTNEVNKPCLAGLA